MTSPAGYHDLIARKRVAFTPRGFRAPALNSALKPHQEHTTAFAIEQGCSAMFLDTGLGKSFASLEWGRCVVEHTNKPVIMLAPLAVGPQHQGEAERWGVDARYIRDPSEISGARVYITNYERLHLFADVECGGTILDESSILKSFTGKTTRALIERFARTPYRLACTATPAPNDYVELGTHAEFLGVMRREDMLTRWFVHDSADTGEWRLKKPAIDDFWAWVASWARAASKPSDLGFSDEGYDLPALDVVRHFVDADMARETDGLLFRMPEMSATSLHKEKRLTVGARADKLAELTLAERNEHRALWVDTDYEADALMARLPDAVEVRGSQSPDEKEEKLVAFARGQVPWLITKARIAGWGSNWQHCARTGLVGVNYSYEAFYQILRRFWRFGQAREVRADIVMAETEAPNCNDEAHFLECYNLVARELYRLTKPGRLCVVHCSDIPRTKATHGHVGLYDFPADLRAAHEAAGWTYHSRVTIWKDPVVEMTRTKALGLLYKQLQTDSTRSRVGMPDYLLVFRKTPEDEKADTDRVGQDASQFPVSQWQQWASPVWMDIDQTNVLNVRAGGRGTEDEKHICPLQLDVIDRAVRLWSNPGDVVLSPFAGIGSEGHEALKVGRKFVGIELKDSYFKQAARNLKAAAREAAKKSIFAEAEAG